MKIYIVVDMPEVKETEMAYEKIEEIISQIENTPIIKDHDWWCEIENNSKVKKISS